MWSCLSFGSWNFHHRCVVFILGGGCFDLVGVVAVWILFRAQKFQFGWRRFWFGGAFLLLVGSFVSGAVIFGLGEGCLFSDGVVLFLRLEMSFRVQWFSLWVEEVLCSVVFLVWWLGLSSRRL